MPIFKTIVRLAGLALAFAGPPLIAMSSFAIPHSADSDVVSLVAIAATVAVVAAVLIIATRWEGATLKGLWFREPSWRGLVIGMAIAAAFIAVIGPLLMRLPLWLGWGGFETGLQQTAATPVWLLLLSILTVASSEEVLYRGYAITRLETLTGSTLLACTISTVVFAFAHVPVWGWGPSCTLLIPGAIFAGLFVWQRDLFPLVVGHVLTDIAGLLVPRLTTQVPWEA